jgi:hypothetical protein
VRSLRRDPLLHARVERLMTGPSGLYVAHGTLGLTDSSAVRSSMQYLSGKDRQRLKTALFPVIGRATCSVALKTVRS